MRAYKNPSSTIIVLGDVTEKTLTRLRNTLRIHGPKGLKVYILSRGSARDLESLRDFIFSNYTFTVEVYIASRDEFKHVFKREDKSIVKILISDPSLVNEVPEHLKELIEVL